MAENGRESNVEQDVMPVEDGNYDWDLFTIGIGSGGTRASRISAQRGAKVAAVELPYHPISSDSQGGIGGTCVLRGCVPKKILMYGSAFSTEFEDCKRYGWTIPGEPTFEWKTLVENKTTEIVRLNGVYKRLLGNAGVTLFEGLGRIVDAHTVEVVSVDGATTTRHTAKHILVATGGRATLLNVPGKEHCITSDEALSLDSMPGSIVIVGGGYIAVEFAGIFNGMGAQVHLMYRADQLLRGFDNEFRAVVANNLKARGIKLYPQTETTKIEKLPSGKLAVTLSKGEQVLEVDDVMMATGRAPNTKKLGLESAGVQLDKKGAIVVSPYSQTNVPSIWAVGDVTNRINLTPVAIMEGHSFAKTVFGGEPTRPDHELVPSAVFCQPPLAVVGLTEEQAAEEAENEVVVYTSSFTPMKLSIAGRQEKAFMKLLVDSATDRVIGAGMCGPDAAEIMQGLAIALRCGATKKQFDTTIGIHPSTAEEFVTMRTPTRRIPGAGKGTHETGAKGHDGT